MCHHHLEAGAARDDCLPPPDDPRTPFNDTALFDPTLGYQDYVMGWGRLIGKLAHRYPKLVSVNVDDLTPNIGPGKVFTPATLARMTSEMRRDTPWVSLVSTCYYFDLAHQPVSAIWPDLPIFLDAPLFYFRDDKNGPGPCADAHCVWGPRSKPGPHISGGCLAGSCADSTVSYAAEEVRWWTRGRLVFPDLVYIPTANFLYGVNTGLIVRCGPAPGR